MQRLKLLHKHSGKTQTKSEPSQSSNKYRLVFGPRGDTYLSVIHHLQQGTCENIWELWELLQSLEISRIFIS